MQKFSYSNNFPLYLFLDSINKLVNLPWLSLSLSVGKLWFPFQYGKTLGIMIICHTLYAAHTQCATAANYIKQAATPPLPPCLLNTQLECTRIEIHIQIVCIAAS